MRIGQSSDIHPLVKGRKLILGGVEIESEFGCDGHSDGDALTHAICESIIGALSLGDIGTLFPDTDPKYKGINSLLLLKEVYEIMDRLNYKIVNVDSLILMEKPKLKDYKKKMEENLARVLNCDVSDVNVKATRGEKLGFVGRCEGIMAQAVVLIEKRG